MNRFSTYCKAGVVLVGLLMGWAVRADNRVYIGNQAGTDLELIPAENGGQALFGLLEPSAGAPAETQTRGLESKWIRPGHIVYLTLPGADQIRRFQLKWKGDSVCQLACATADGAARVTVLAEGRDPRFEWDLVAEDILVFWGLAASAPSGPK